MKALREEDWEEVGVIGVDAGLCWIGDPCYVLHRQGEKAPEDIGKDWGEFCGKFDELKYLPYTEEETQELGISNETFKTLKGKAYIASKDTLQFNYDKGHKGLGVCVSTGYGDGFYPVLVKRNAEGRVMAVMVDFGLEEDEDE